MNKQTEALKMAIEVLCLVEEYDDNGVNVAKKAIQACKEALEQPAQEPVAYFKKWEDKSGEHKDIKFSNSEGYKPLYTHPKEWQGMSDDEIWNIANFLGKNKEWDYPVMFAKTIEQALKEKQNE